MYEKSTLDNGLRTLVSTMPYMESVALGIWISAGGRHENRKISGVSHFLEHLHFKGTKKRSSKKIKECIEGMGGLLNGFTGEEFTCYLVKILNKHLHLALDVLSDMVLNATLGREDIEKERGVIIEEIRMYKDIPAYIVSELLDQLLWPNQPLGMNLTGTVETISSIRREDLFKYKNKFYKPQNIVISAVGSINHKDVLIESERYFSKISPTAKSYFQKAKVTQIRPKTKFHFKETEQTHISLGTHTFHRDHPDKYALSILHIILGANMSSRLFQEVREKRGLAYEIGTHLKKYQDTGAFIVSAGVDNKNYPKTIEVILRELVKIKKELVKKIELRRAKEFYIGQFLLTLENTLDHMLWLGENMTTLGKVDLPDKILKEVNKVSIEDLNRVANRIFKSENLNFALVGPINDKDKKRIEKMIDLG